MIGQPWLLSVFWIVVRVAVLVVVLVVTVFVFM